jgi:hypothetical protein
VEIVRSGKSQISLGSLDFFSCTAQIRWMGLSLSFYISDDISVEV